MGYWASTPGAVLVVWVCIQPPDVAVAAVRPELHSAADLKHHALWVLAAVEVVVLPVRLESARQLFQVSAQGGSLVQTHRVF